MSTQWVAMAVSESVSVGAEVFRLCSRRAELLRELAELEIQLGRAFESAARPPAEAADAVLLLPEAAAFMGECTSTFRRRVEYAKALVSRPTERRRRYSRAALERIRQDRLAASGLEAWRSSTTGQR